MKFSAFNFFLPEFFFARFALGFGGSDFSKRSQTTDSSSTINDSKTGASEGSSAFGSGSHDNVVINSDGKTLERVAETVQETSSTAIREVSGAARDISATAIQNNTEVARDSVAAQKDTAGNALNFGYDFGTQALKTVQTLLAKNDEQTANLIKDTNSQFISTLGRNAGDAPQTVFQDSQKMVLYGFGILAALGAVYILSKKSS